jgi:lipopolysaccharide export system protein LptA
MKFLMQNNPLGWWLTISLLAFCLPAMALTSDSKQPVKLEALNQSLDLGKNTTTLTDQVVITRGSTKITADKVVVFRPDGDSRKTIIDAWGTPATFYEMQDNGKPIQGHANHLHYDLAKDIVTLTGKAFVQQQDCSIKGELITYKVKEQQMQAFGNDMKNRVMSVIVPEQLQNNTNTKATGSK